MYGGTLSPEGNYVLDSLSSININGGLVRLVATNPMSTTWKLNVGYAGVRFLSNYVDANLATYDVSLTATLPRRSATATTSAAARWAATRPTASAPTAIPSLTRSAAF